MKLPLTQHLVEEHRKIERILTRLKAQAFAPRAPQPMELRKTLRTLVLALETIHHAKEETILLPALDELSCAHGGPLCGLFMGIRIESDPAGVILKQAGLVYPPLKDRGRSSQISEIIAKNSFLGIPVEEHEAGHLGVELMLRELDCLEQDGSRSRDRFAILLGSYLRLMDFHIRKEDECLFVMVDELLSRERQSALLDQALQIELKLGRADRELLDNFSD